MNESLTIVAIFFIGFFHAFEIDHLAVVSNMVTKRKTVLSAIKDGIFWGLGHSSTIFLVGMALIFLKFSFAATFFAFFEGIIGLVLIIIGIIRLYQLYTKKEADELIHKPHSHKLAYGVGLIHGLAGSGSIVLFIISSVESRWNGVLFLLVFGIGSIIGMLIAAGIFSLPFSKRVSTNIYINMGLIILSSCICIGIGSLLFYENLL